MSSTKSSDAQGRQLSAIAARQATASYVSSYWLSHHLATVLAGLAVLVTAVRVMAIANLDPVTGMAILQTVGIATTLVGTLVALLPLLISFALLISLSVRQVRKKSKSDTLPVDALVMLLAAFSFFLVPWQLLLAVLAPHPLYLIAKRWTRGARRRWSQQQPRTLRRAAAMVPKFFLAYLVVAATYNVLVAQPWFAPEVLTTQDGEVIPGYVLKSDADETVVMRFVDRHILYVRGRVDRQICDAPVLPGVSGESLYRLLSPQAEYPPCPDRETLDKDGHLN